jgi:hypothetical protein
MEKDSSRFPLWVEIIGLILLGGLLIVVTLLTKGELVGLVDLDFDFFSHRKKKKDKEKQYKEMANQFSRKTIDEMSSDMIDETSSETIED